MVVFKIDLESMPTEFPNETLEPSLHSELQGWSGFSYLKLLGVFF